MRFLLVWVVLQPQPRLQDGFPQTKQPKKLWEFRCRAGRHHPEPPGDIPEADWAAPRGRGSWFIIFVPPRSCLTPKSCRGQRRLASRFK